MFAAGTVAATLINLHLPKDAKAINPIDFVPEYDGQSREPKPTPEISLRDQIANLTRGFGCGPTKEQLERLLPN